MQTIHGVLMAASGSGLHLCVCLKKVLFQVVHDHSDYLAGLWVVLFASSMMSHL